MIWAQVCVLGVGWGGVGGLFLLCNALLLFRYVLLLVKVSLTNGGVSCKLGCLGFEQNFPLYECGESNATLPRQSTVDQECWVLLFCFLMHCEESQDSVIKQRRSR